MAYWISVYSVQTWKESLEYTTLSGFTTKVGYLAKQIKVGDIILCYLAHGVSRFVGLKLVTGDCYRDDAPLFGKYEGSPWRITVEPIVLLTPETAVPIKEIEGLSFNFDAGWGHRVRKALNTWDDADGQIVEQALRFAQIVDQRPSLGHDRTTPTALIHFANLFHEMAFYRCRWRAILRSLFLKNQ